MYTVKLGILKSGWNYKPSTWGNKKDKSYQGRDLRVLQSKGFVGQVMFLEGLQIVGYR